LGKNWRGSRRGAAGVEWGRIWGGSIPLPSAGGVWGGATALFSENLKFLPKMAHFGAFSGIKKIVMSASETC